GVAVAAHRAVRRTRIRAGSRPRIARAGDVALIARSAYDRVGTRARPSLARVRLRASVPVIARGCLVRVYADTTLVARIVRTRIPVITATVGGAVVQSPIAVLVDRVADLECSR